MKTISFFCCFITDFVGLDKKSHPVYLTVPFVRQKEPGGHENVMLLKNYSYPRFLSNKIKLDHHHLNNDRQLPRYFQFDSLSKRL